MTTEEFIKMDDYISRKAAMSLPPLPKEFREYQTFNLDDAYDTGWNDALDCLKYIPVEDVVKVVRCRDCAVPHNRWTGCPKLSGLIPPDDFYCAFGKQKAALGGDGDG